MNDFSVLLACDQCNTEHGNQNGGSTCDDRTATALFFGRFISNLTGISRRIGLGRIGLGCMSFLDRIGIQFGTEGNLFGSSFGNLCDLTRLVVIIDLNDQATPSQFSPGPGQLERSS